MSEFSLEQASERHALMLTRGVPDNHARALARGFHYRDENILLLPTTSIEEHMPSIGLSPQWEQIPQYGDDIRDYIRKAYGTLLDYDVHFIDGTPEPEDALVGHWRSIANNLAGERQKGSQVIRSLNWHYEHFDYGNVSLEEYFPDWDERTKLSILRRMISENNLPYRFGYADAELIDTHGELEAAIVEFTYPLEVRLKKTYKPETKIYDAYGHEITATTNVTRHVYRQPITEGQEADLNYLRNFHDAAVAQGKIPQLDNRNTEEIVLAPYYNSF